MLVNTNTGALTLTATEKRQIEAARKIFINLGKHAGDDVQADAAKVVCGINRVQLAFEDDDESDPLQADQTKVKQTA